MTEQTLDVKGSLRLFRRFWRTIAVFALVGLLVAAGYELWRPPVYRATAMVLLPGAAAAAVAASGGSQTPAGNDIATDGQIATSAAVLKPAGVQADLSLSLDALHQRVTTTTYAAGVLGITATGPTVQQAEALANAVADRLVAFATTDGSTAGLGALSALQAESSQLGSQLKDVQQELTTANNRLAADGAQSPAGQQDSNLVAQLTAEKSSLTLQADTVKSQIAQAELGQVSANQGTEVIQQATLTGAGVTSLVLGLILGLLGGVLVGAVVVLARHRRDPRLWTRDGLADALGSPVMLSLQVPRTRSSSDWVEALERSQPTSSERWNVRLALRELGTTEEELTQLVVLVLAGDTAGAALATQVAVVTAASGLQTRFALVTEEDSMAGLQAAVSRFSTRGQGPRPDLEVLIGDPPRRDAPPDLTVTAVVLDQGRPALPSSLAGAVTVLAVSAGVATAEQLARVAIAAADNRQPLRGVFVANPGVEDQTTGRFPDSTARTLLVLRRRTLGATSGTASGAER